MTEELNEIKIEIVKLQGCTAALTKSVDKIIPELEKLSKANNTLRTITRGIFMVTPIVIAVLVYLKI